MSKSNERCSESDSEGAQPNCGSPNDEEYKIVEGSDWEDFQFPAGSCDDYAIQALNTREVLNRSSVTADVRFARAKG